MSAILYGDGLAHWGALALALTSALTSGFYAARTSVRGGPS